MVSSICVSSVVRVVVFVIASSPWLNITTTFWPITVFAMTSQHKQCFGCQAPVPSPQIIIFGEYMRLQCLQICAKFCDLSFPFEEDIALALCPETPRCIALSVILLNICNNHVVQVVV